MPLRGPTNDDDLTVTRGKPVNTPGVGTKYRDPISGARKPDEFFSIGDHKGRDISGLIDRASRNNGRGKCRC
jgi:hypothetical protein